jgi:hypothetical protein
MNDHDDTTKITKLADTFTDTLRRNGGIRAAFGTAHERDLYRRAGRKAGRTLKRPVHTMISGNDVLIWLDDWGENPLERQLEHVRVRKALDNVSPP